MTWDPNLKAKVYDSFKNVSQPILSKEKKRIGDVEYEIAWVKGDKINLFSRIAKASGSLFANVITFGQAKRFMPVKRWWQEGKNGFVRELVVIKSNPPKPNILSSLSTEEKSKSRPIYRTFKYDDFPEKVRASLFQKFSYDLKIDISPRERFSLEVERLNKFLDEGKPEHDFVYVSIGHGRVEEQIWPGFVFDALHQKKKTLLMLFEFGSILKYPSGPFLHHVLGSYSRYPNCSEDHFEDFMQLDIEQFLCGLPTDISSDQEFTSQLEQNKDLADWHQPGIPKDASQKVIQNFENYLEKLLATKKQVVIGYHIDGLDADNPISKLYNRLNAKYPGQIKMLWGWEGANKFTDQQVPADNNLHNPIWSDCPNLFECKF